MRTSLMAVALLSVVAGSASAQQQPLTIHGYLTQAYGHSEGGTMLGVPTRGTTNYRNAALQFRYAMSPSDNATVQLSHRRLGEDVAAANEADVRLDWAFYGHDFGAVDIKVGRAPIPSGIYNEFRDVGVLLPLYRAPFVFYLEGTFTSETVDGVVGTWQVGSARGWSLELAGFAGGWTMSERFVDGSGTVQSRESRIERGVGARAWIGTPINGVRFGGGASNFQAEDAAIVPGWWNERHVSLDASLERVTLRSEARRITSDDFTYDAWYAYAGVRPFGALGLHAQIEQSDLDLPPVPQLDFHDGVAVGASWSFRPNLVLKLEGHWTESYWAENPPVRIGADTPRKITTGIISLSTSF